MVWSIPITAFLESVLFVPVEIDRACYLGQPGTVFDRLKEVQGGKELDSVGRRIAQWLEEARRDEDRDVVRLAIEEPCSLLGRQACRKLSEQAQELALVLFHVSHSRV